MQLPKARFALERPKTREPVQPTRKDPPSEILSREARRPPPAEAVNLCKRPAIWRTVRNADVFVRPSDSSRKTVQIFPEVHVEVQWCDKAWLRIVSRQGEMGYMRRGDAVRTRHPVRKR